MRAPGSLRALAGGWLGLVRAGWGVGALVGPVRAFGRPELVWSSRCFIYYFFNRQAHPRPSPKGAEALLGGRGGRQGPACLWHDWRAPGCHFVTAAVVAGGGGGRTLRHYPDGPGREGSRGIWPRDPRMWSGPL